MPLSDNLVINDDTYLAVLTGVDAYGWTFCHEAVVRGSLFPRGTTRLTAAVTALCYALHAAPGQPLPPLPRGRLRLYWINSYSGVFAGDVDGPVAKADVKAQAERAAEHEAAFRRGLCNPVGTEVVGPAGTCNLVEIDFAPGAVVGERLVGGRPVPTIDLLPELPLFALQLAAHTRKRTEFYAAQQTGRWSSQQPNLSAMPRQEPPPPTPNRSVHFAWAAWEDAAIAATRAALHGPAVDEAAEAVRLWYVAAALGPDDRPSGQRW